MSKLNAEVTIKTKSFLDFVRERMSENEFNDFSERIEFVKKQKEFIESIKTENRGLLESRIVHPYEQFKRGEELQKESLAKAVILLAEYGWYTNYSFSLIDITKATTLLKTGKFSDLNTYMLKCIQEQYTDIKKTLLDRHPARAKPLGAAFQAHESEEYDLSIPVFFAQIDGISKDLTQLQFFLNDKNHAPKVSKWAKKRPKIWMHAGLCAALLDKGAFQKHHSQPNEIGFTRHSVLHGETNDYGTELNSFKAISLLIYVSDVMSPLALANP